MLRPINPPGLDKSIIADLATTQEDGLMSYVDKVKIDTNVLFQDNSLQLTNFPSGGSIGSANNNVDKYTSIAINQTSGGQNLIIPNPTNVNNVRYLFLSNNGTASFTCFSSTFYPNTTNLYIWNNTSWNFIASTDQQILLSFNVYSTSVDYTITSWNCGVVIDTSGLVLNITLPPCSIANQGQMVVLSRAGSTTGSVNINTSLLNVQNIIPYNIQSVNQLNNLYESVVVISTIYGPIISSTNKNDPIFLGATNLLNGKSGWVPAPLVNEDNKFLKGNSTWAYPLLEAKSLLSNTSVSVFENKEYHSDSSAGPITAILPFQPNNGTLIRFIDSTNSWPTNNLIIQPTGTDKINGLNSNVTIVNGTIIELFYDTLNNNWLFRSSSDSFSYAGLWNATTNTPTITNGVGINGQYYKVSVAGNTNIDGINTWLVNDWIIFNGLSWDRIEASAVKSVNSYTGVVTLTKTDIGLANVDNTSDANKPLSTATTTALSNKLDYPIATLLNQTSTPSNPSNGYLKLYSKADYNLYKLDNSGNEVLLSTGGTITLSGDVVNDINNVTTIQPNVVTNSKLAQSTQYTWKGNNTNTTANQADNALGNITELDSSILTISGTNSVLNNATVKANLDDGKIYVGNASNVPVGVTMSGDASIDNTGALTLATNSVTNTKLAQSTQYTWKGNNTNATANQADNALGNITELDSSILTISGINSVLNNATIKANLTSGKIYIGDVSNVPVGVTMSGDASIDNTGAITIKTGVNLAGNPTTTTQTTTDSSTKIATTAFVQANKNPVSTTLANQTASGALVVNVNNFDLIIIPQTTAGLTFTLDTPTTTTRALRVENSGSTSFIMYNATISAGAFINFIYDGTTWISDFFTSSSTPTLTELAISNVSSSGVLGTVSNVDSFDKFSVNQTTTNISVTLPTPSSNKLLYVQNIGTASFILYNLNVNPNCYVSLQYSNSTWIILTTERGYKSISTNTTLVNNTDYSVNTSGGALTLELPAVSFHGAIIELFDTYISWHYNNITINGNIDNLNTIKITGDYHIKLKFDSNSNQWLSNNKSEILPVFSYSNYSRNGINNYIYNLTKKYTNTQTNIIRYPNTTSIGISFAFKGGVYSPTQNRIYLVPYALSNGANWYYIDCNNGSIVAYANTSGANINAYFGGAYSPVQNRIYFAPYEQANQPNWHYIDCNNGNINSYTNTSDAAFGAYQGAVYSPIQNRIYFVPYIQANNPNWHYIDCSTGNIVAYGNTSGAVIGAYVGGVYSPIQNRIYFAPNNQTTEANWHYINCATGAIVAYTNTSGALQGYCGATYSPVQNRIYFIPYGESNKPNWHYINCNTGNIVAYTNTSGAVGSAYWGGVYSPVQNRIYLVPYGQANDPNWHYIDCNTGNIVAYTNTSNAIANGYMSGIYSPLQNRIYFIPASMSNTSWHYIETYISEPTSKLLMSGAMFNNS